ncbi:hypothetical protein EDB85DRAFT_1889687 [Lactarius pseudohatsudake]|nr:hypothetical protein EDB85DRAFT_1889687 [Lactarius pseudohatsudake]
MGMQGLESVQSTAKSSQARGRTKTYIITCWVSPTALGGATPMDSATADVPVEAQIGTIEGGGQLLQGAQVSSFRQKQKIQNMAEIFTTGSSDFPARLGPKIWVTARLLVAQGLTTWRPEPLPAAHEGLGPTRPAAPRLRPDTASQPRLHHNRQRNTSSIYIQTSA